MPEQLQSNCQGYNLLFLLLYLLQLHPYFLSAFATRGTNGGEKIKAVAVIRKLSASTLNIFASIR